jgi:hypothetical protein
MKVGLSILILLKCVFSVGQGFSDSSIYLLSKGTKGLIVVDSLTINDVIGGFAKTDGFGGFSYILDSNGTFQKIDCSENASSSYAL